MNKMTLIAAWLWFVAAMIFVMVIIGGLTRLTESGLSMVDWRPVTGWLPPLGSAEWQATFAAYRTSPEYQEINAGMSLSEFKGIFWLEYIHRLWGRLIGLVFIVPFAFFLVRGWVSWRLAGRLTLMLILGGSQGVLGWYMVQSGLSNEPWVSPYRLVAHLGLALAVFVLVIWTALDLAEGARRPKIGMPMASLIWIFLTVLSGGAVAGMNAGLTYNTFPMMDGAIIPSQIWDSPTFFANLFEDVRTVQFNHRAMATCAVILVLLTWIWRMRSRGRVPYWGHCAAGLVCLQYALGIATLLSVVAIPIASSHQAFGTLLLAALVGWAHYDGRNRAYASEKGQELDGMSGNPVAG